MNDRQPQVLRQTALITVVCIAGSVAITAAVTYLVTGELDLGVGLLIAVLAPAILVPIGSYSLIALAAQLQEANNQLRTLSETDPLTHTCNRRHFLTTAEGQLALARRHGFPTSVLLIDFDRFKDINDRMGHQAGDYVLVEASRLIKSTLRDTDTLARFGGEEFVVLLPHTRREGALMAADRILQVIRGHAFRHQDQALRVTVSIGGVTSHTSHASLEQMTSRADHLMYQAKEAGRDRRLIESLPPQDVVPLQDAGRS